MKKILIIILTLSLFATRPIYANVEQGIIVRLDGKTVKFDVQPVNIDNRILVPMRRIFEVLGMEIKWDNDNQRVYATKDDSKIELKVGERHAKRNGEEIKLDVPAQVVNGRVMVPVRFIAESTGTSIKWDNENNIVFINTFEPLYKIIVDEKEGYIDKNGSIVIKPQFEKCNPFSEGLALCKKDGKWLYIDNKGNMAIDGGDYIWCSDFSEGLAAVYAENKLGYINKKGEFVIETDISKDNYQWSFFNFKVKELNPNYADLSSERNFSEGLAAAYDSNGKGVYIDKTGKVVLSTKYYSVSPFVEGKARGLIKDKNFIESLYDYIDKDGRVTSKEVYGITSNDYSEGLAGVELHDGKKGFINYDGELVFSLECNYAGDFHEDVAVVSVNRKWGIIDKQGNFIIKPKFDLIGDFSEGLAVAVQDGKLGFIDKKGDFVIDPQFAPYGFPFYDTVKDRLRLDFSDGLVYIYNDRYVDRKGNTVWKK